MLCGRENHTEEFPEFLKGFLDLISRWRSEFSHSSFSSQRVRVSGAANRVPDSRGLLEGASCPIKVVGSVSTIKGFLEENKRKFAHSRKGVRQYKY